MEKKFLNSNLIIFSFLAILFILTVSLYYISILLGFKGLAIPLLGGGDDGVFYYNNALEIKNGGNAILTSIHVLVLGYVLKILDTEYVFYLRLFNYLGIVLFVIVHVFLLKCISAKERLLDNINLFFLMMLFYVSFLFISTISILRDIWIVNYFSLSCLFFLLILKSRIEFKILYFLPLIFSCMILFNYRDYALLSFIGGSLLFIFFNRKNKSTNTFLLISVVIIIMGIYYTIFKDLKLPIVDMSLADGLKYRKDGQELYAGDSQMNIVLDQPNYLLFLINYIYSLVSNSIGPLPNQFTGFGAIVLFFAETIPMSIILIYIFKNRKFIDYYDKYFLTQSLVWFLFIGITNDNLGTASRLRILAYVLILIVFIRITNKIKDKVTI